MLFAVGGGRKGSGGDEIVINFPTANKLNQRSFERILLNDHRTDMGNKRKRVEQV